MPSSFTVAGVTDTLSPENEKYADALNDVGKTMETVLSIVQTPQFETMEGWKKKKENKIDTVYSKRFECGKIFTCRTVLPMARETIFTEHWDNFVETAKLSKNTSFVEKVAILSPHCEIVHVKFREIVGSNFR
ncbi:hypothetical protein AB6A40_011002 [Gnathostoma spinigerum]|uniref:Uncharacterized protein n=1 Tax=Gnathostoma spinigerum TaxID=75299 RepID=A0ABD6EWG5_9BILA